MRFFSGRLLTNALDHCEILCPAELNLRPGQYFLAAPAGSLDALPAVLYPSKKVGKRLIVNRPYPNDWQVGTVLNLRGPLGRGFHFPSAARRIAIIDNCSVERPASIFKFWMEEVLERGGELVYYSDYHPAGLPTAVEGLPLEQAGEAWKWAEYLAADVDLSQLEALVRILRPNPDSRLPDQSEALIRTTMVCGGQAECGLCAVKTRTGLRLACKHGPVFPLYELFGEKR
ncbi:MAG: hypothetical protein AB9891_09575 [Anaerolineaceae bacterium]